jgi:hypothetical protein
MSARVKPGDHKVSNPHRSSDASKGQENENLSQPGPKPLDDPLVCYEETLTSIGPSSDRLLAEPSLLANSLFPNQQLEEIRRRPTGEIILANTLFRSWPHQDEYEHGF